MKVLLVSIVCAVLSGATCSVVGWPGAIPISSSYVHNVVAPQVKAFGYSTSQFVGAVQPSYAITNEYGYQPQISYQVPVTSSLAYYPQQTYHTYQPIVAPAYYPSSSFFYPTLTPGAISPINQVQVTQPQAPNAPSQGGDEDTTVVESAEYSAQQQSMGQQTQEVAPSNAYLPIPMAQEQAPSMPSESSAAPPSSAPAAENQGMNDEDTVSVDSA